MVSILLASGLTPDNVADAIKTVRPFAGDVCSGVRNNSKLDAMKLKRFFQEIENSIHQIADEPASNFLSKIERTSSFNIL